MHSSPSVQGDADDYQLFESLSVIAADDLLGHHYSVETRPTYISCTDSYYTPLDSVSDVH
jgi:hypothetical protein